MVYLRETCQRIRMLQISPSLDETRASILMQAYFNPCVDTFPLRCPFGKDFASTSPCEHHRMAVPTQGLHTLQEDILNEEMPVNHL
jgi:hypothetical protein